MHDDPLRELVNALEACEHHTPDGVTEAVVHHWRLGVKTLPQNIAGYAHAQRLFAALVAARQPAPGGSEGAAGEEERP